MRAGGRVTGLRPAKLLVVAVVAIVLAASASVSLAGQVALVVGNSTYAHIGRLPNPENDAVDLAAALRRLGFEVTTELDADRVELTEALRAFTRRSAGADVSLVFYAGHGLEMDGVNYLVPVDARLERDVDVRYETVTLDDLLVATLGARLRLVILDACRNNPLARSMQRTVASRSVSGGSFGQLNEDLLGDETLVAYAAAAGTTAADGTGRNSPYTSALLAHLDEPLEILTLFRRVRARVLEATNGEQRPHEYQSLLREHYLSGAPAVEAVTVEADAPDVADVDVGELDVAQLRVLAERGDAEAQAELGERYEHGRLGVEQDYGEAVSWYRKAAAQGNVRGQANLGAMYGSARGVAHDDAEAVRGTGERPSRDTPLRNSVSASTTRTVEVSPEATRRPSGGTDWPPTRRTSKRRPISAECTATGAVYSGTSPRRSGGSGERLNRVRCTRRPRSAGCTSRAVACAAIVWRQPAGTVWRPTRGMPTHRRDSTAFGDLDLARSQRWAGGWGKRPAPCLDHDALDLVERHRIRRPVVQLRRLRRRVPGDPLRMFERAPVREVRRDPRRPKRVAARRRRQPRRHRPPLESSPERPDAPAAARSAGRPGRRSETAAPSRPQGSRRRDTPRSPPRPGGGPARRAASHPSRAAAASPARPAGSSPGGCASAVRSLHAAVSPEPGDAVVGLSVDQINRRFAAACAAAGLEGRRTSHGGRVGLAVELTARGLPPTPSSSPAGGRTPPRSSATPRARAQG